MDWIELQCVRNDLHYVTLYCIVLYCIVLYCIVLYCIVLLQINFTPLYYSTAHHSILTTSININVNITFIRFGTPAYMCPQYNRTGKYEEKSEVRIRVTDLSIFVFFICSCILLDERLFDEQIVFLNPSLSYQIQHQINRWPSNSLHQIFSFGLVLAELFSGILQTVAADSGEPLEER